MRRGSAYLFVMIIMFSIFIMLTVSISLTSQSAKVSFAYSDNANLYYLAVDFTEKFVAELNEQLVSQRNEIHEEIFERVKVRLEESPEEYIFYEDNSGNVYEGNFYLKEEDVTIGGVVILSGEKNNLYALLYRSYVLSIFNSRLMDGESIARYEITIEENSVPTKYEILITYLDERNGVYKFRSTARNLTNRNSDSVIAELVLTIDEHKEVLYENYQFRIEPEYLNKNSFLTNEDLQVNEDIEIYLRDHEWTEKNPVAYYSVGETVDISKFYNDSEPVPTILILEDENFIYSEDENKRFTGVIYTNGELEISEDVLIEHKNNFLDIIIDTVSFRRMIYDYFQLTDFQSLQAKLIFKELKLSEKFSLHITSLPYYKINTLKKEDE